ncbi:MAG TPA: hypothetical protein VJ783_00055 [Pirellulales bacterium]|nr:hypothetical protein [Pirellulales bacterium]
MTGVLADVNIEGHVNYLMALVRAAPWADLWEELGVKYLTFGDVSLDREATDSEVWRVCQERELVLITGNRNSAGADSLEATIRVSNTNQSLPVLTISNTERFKNNRDYAKEVVVSLVRVLIGIDELRGTGRLYLP